eukprot:scaffold5541_cov24-Tisochrysis_lutea.AAC.2
MERRGDPESLLEQLGLGGAAVALPRFLDARGMAPLCGAVLHPNSKSWCDPTTRRVIPFVELERPAIVGDVATRLAERRELRAWPIQQLEVLDGSLLESAPGGRAQRLHADFLRAEFARIVRESGGVRHGSLLVTLALLLLNCRMGEAGVTEVVPLAEPGDALWLDGDV